MHNKLITFLLLLNLIATSTLCYTLYTNDSEARLAAEVKEDYEKFKSNMYQGLGMLMSGQSQLSANQQRLNIDILRIHHFVEPHDEKFYEGCPECQLEHPEKLKDIRDNITSGEEDNRWNF
mgnify:FL=1